MQLLCILKRSKLLLSSFLLVFANTQLDRCQESDRGRVFEINLNGQALVQVPDLKEVGLQLASV